MSNNKTYLEQNTLDEIATTIFYLCNDVHQIRNARLATLPDWAKSVKLFTDISMTEKGDAANKNTL